MERQGRLSEAELRALGEELSFLTKQQSDARLLEVYIRMTKQEPPISTADATAFLQST